VQPRNEGNGQRAEVSKNSKIQAAARFEREIRELRVNGSSRVTLSTKAAIDEQHDTNPQKAGILFRDLKALDSPWI